MLHIDEKLYFVLETISVLRYDEHFMGFRAGTTEGNFKIKIINDFVYPPFELHKTYDGNFNIFRIKNF
jgi:hypothetical protein